ncbi:MAG: cyd operon YbgE family protein [Azovibrio sp.]|uniref:cyd operon YbgE family protein n=1 Tax=Azovibrio sp. TaxID=1872673 RepID=UPI003C74C3E0
MGAHLPDLPRKPGPRAPWGQNLSLFLGLASALLLVLDPRLVAENMAELRHSELLLLLTAIALCLVRGVGFQFKPGSPGQWITHPFTAWPLLALAWWKLLH